MGETIAPTKAIPASQEILVHSKPVNTLSQWLISFIPSNSWFLSATGLSHEFAIGHDQVPDDVTAGPW